MQVLLDKKYAINIEKKIWVKQIILRGVTIHEILTVKRSLIMTVLNILHQEKMKNYIFSNL